MYVSWSRENPNRKGNVAEAMIHARALQHGFEVLRPVGEHSRYDMALDLGGAGIVRVQCKWGRLAEEVITAKLESSRWTPAGRVTKAYEPGEIDLFAIYCEAIDSCYMIPYSIVPGQRTVQLRLGPPRNGQRAGLHYAADYGFPGAVAQLGEHSAGSRKVVGSNPISSTLEDSHDRTTVGAHEFRNHFGWYMQRAAAGETFEVTRRGKPHVVLSGPE